MSREQRLEEEMLAHEIHSASTQDLIWDAQRYIAAMNVGGLVAIDRWDEMDGVCLTLTLSELEKRGVVTFH